MDKSQELLCTECGEKNGEIFLCGEGYFCAECYDIAINTKQ